MTFGRREFWVLTLALINSTTRAYVSGGHATGHGALFQLTNFKRFQGFSFPLVILPLHPLSAETASQFRLKQILYFSHSSACTRDLVSSHFDSSTHFTMFMTFQNLYLSAVVICS